MKIAVALSGGVDSSVSAMILKSEGHEVMGVTFDLGEHGESAIEDAAKVAEHLQIQHLVMDYRELFQQVVVEDFLACYLSGKTPNPCILCNKKIKFGRFMEDALALGCDKVATGHYAQVVYQDGHPYISRASDRHKDQSYALCRLSAEQISRVLLPVHPYTKTELRALAEKGGLPVAHRPDSQDICFIPSGDHTAFIEANGKVDLSAGNFIDTHGKPLGKHKGIHHYTIGQRKRLGISLGQHAYVQQINPINNEILLTTCEQDIFSTQVTISDLAGSNIPAIFARPHLTGKLRYAHQGSGIAQIQQTPSGAIVTFQSPQRAPTPGQTLVIYDGDLVLGGGTICSC